VEGLKISVFYEGNEILDQDRQYVLYGDGIVIDTNTHLEWVAGPDEDTDWNDAKNWVENLSLAGGGWRMPSGEELMGLYYKGRGTHNMTPLLKSTSWWMWSGETRDSSSACYFDFYNGFVSWYASDYVNGRRVFAVRSLNR